MSNSASSAPSILSWPTAVRKGSAPLARAMDGSSADASATPAAMMWRCVTEKTGTLSAVRNKSKSSLVKIFNPDFIYLEIILLFWGFFFSFFFLGGGVCLFCSLLLGGGGCYGVVLFCCCCFVLLFILRCRDLNCSSGF